MRQPLLRSIRGHENRLHSVVVDLGNRILLVIMAAGAAHGHAEHHAGRGVEDAVEVVVLGEWNVGGFIVPDTKPVVAGGDDARG